MYVSPLKQKSSTNTFSPVSVLLRSVEDDLASLMKIIAMFDCQQSMTSRRVNFEKQGSSPIGSDSA